MTHDEIKPVWNAQADEFNQRAMAYAVAKLAAQPSENLQPNPEKIFSNP